MDALASPLICIAPNGARLTQKEHKAVPILPSELADCAESCLEAGAGMIHLHVRNDAQGHILDVERYKAAIAAVRERVANEMIIQITTEAVGMYKAPEQMAVVRALKPEAVSLGLRELVPSEETVEEFADFWKWLTEEGVLAQIILYDQEDVRKFLSYRAQGLFGNSSPMSVLFVLGRYGKQLAVPSDLLPFLEEAKNEAGLIWSVCAFGAFENACVTTAAALGGNIRIGFENNRTMADGSVAKDNVALVKQCVATLKSSGMKPMSGVQARKVFQGLS